jgi:hypothetical protein
MPEMAALLANDSGGGNTRCSCITDSMADIARLLKGRYGFDTFAATLRCAAYCNLTLSLLSFPVLQAEGALRCSNGAGWGVARVASACEA